MFWGGLGGLPWFLCGSGGPELSQQKTLTEGVCNSKCLDFLNKFRKSPDVYGV